MKKLALICLFSIPTASVAMDNKSKITIPENTPIIKRITGYTATLPNGNLIAVDFFQNRKNGDEYDCKFINREKANHFDAKELPKSYYSLLKKLYEKQKENK